MYGEDTAGIVEGYVEGKAFPDTAVYAATSIAVIHQKH